MPFTSPRGGRIIGSGASGGTCRLLLPPDPGRTHPRELFRPSLTPCPSVHETRIVAQNQKDDANGLPWRGFPERISTTRLVPKRPAPGARRQWHQEPNKSRTKAQQGPNKAAQGRQCKAGTVKDAAARALPSLQRGATQGTAPNAKDKRPLAASATVRFSEWC